MKSHTLTNIAGSTFRVNQYKCCPTRTDWSVHPTPCIITLTMFGIRVFWPIPAKNWRFSRLVSRAWFSFFHPTNSWWLFEISRCHCLHRICHIRGYWHLNLLVPLSGVPRRPRDFWSKIQSPLRVWYTKLWYLCQILIKCHWVIKKIIDTLLLSRRSWMKRILGRVDKL